MVWPSCWESEAIVAMGVEVVSVDMSLSVY
jgi:hypothetical protein